MDRKVLEICSGINEIQLTSKLLLKRINKILDAGNKQCTCRCESESFETEIRNLQSHVKILEDKIIAAEESRKNNDLKMLTSRLDMIADISNSELVQKKDCDTQSKIETAREIDLNDSKADEIETLEQESSIVPQQQTSKNKKSETRIVNENASDGKSDTVGTNEYPVINGSAGSIRYKIEDSEKLPTVLSQQCAKEATKTKSKSNFAIRKPNFTKPKPPELCLRNNKDNLSVELIKQEVEIVEDWGEYWQSQAKIVHKEYHARSMSLKGVISVICLDISESMAKSDAWTEARSFITDYLTGLEDMSKTNSTETKSEYVVLITFGHQTKVQVEYTDNFRNIEKALDETELGGPTQMFGGLLLAFAAVWPCDDHLIRHSDRSRTGNKIIMISDGRPTEEDLIAGPDIADSRKIDKTKANLFQKMEKINSHNTNELFFVPVGEADIDFLKTLAECSDGMLLDYRQGMILAKRLNLAERKSTEKSRRRNLHLTNTTDISANECQVKKRSDRHCKLKKESGLSGTVMRNFDVGWNVDGHQNIYLDEQQGYAVLLVEESKVHKAMAIAIECTNALGGSFSAAAESNKSLGAERKKKIHKKKGRHKHSNNVFADLFADRQGRQVQKDCDPCCVTTYSGAVTTQQYFELESPKAMTIEEYAKVKRKEDKNSK